MDKLNVTKEDLQESIEKLANAFQKQSEVSHKGTIEAMLTKHHYLNIEDPEELSLLLAITHGEQKHILVKMATRNIQVSDEVMWKIYYVYSEYEFIKIHLLSIIDKYEGYGCSVDKTRWLIDTYVKHLKGEKVDELTERNYWNPKKGKVNDWLKWIDAIVRMYTGDSDNYFEQKRNLVDLYKEIGDE